VLSKTIARIQQRSWQGLSSFKGLQRMNMRMIMWGCIVSQQMADCRTNYGPIIFHGINGSMMKQAFSSDFH
jgi:hypothetical protein